MGPSTAGGGLDPSFCTSRSEEARGQVLSESERDLSQGQLGMKLLEVEVSVGGRRTEAGLSQGRLA